MDSATHNKILSFMWGIPGAVRRDPSTRGRIAEVHNGSKSLSQLDEEGIYRRMEAQSA